MRSRLALILVALTAGCLLLVPAGSAPAQNETSGGPAGAGQERAAADEGEPAPEAQDESWLTFLDARELWEAAPLAAWLDWLRKRRES